MHAPLCVNAGDAVLLHADAVTPRWRCAWWRVSACSTPRAARGRVAVRGLAVLPHLRTARDQVEEEGLGRGGSPCVFAFDSALASDAPAFNAPAFDALGLRLLRSACRGVDGCLIAFGNAPGAAIALTQRLVELVLGGGGGGGSSGEGCRARAPIRQDRGRRAHGPALARRRRRRPAPPHPSPPVSRKRATACTWDAARSSAEAASLLRGGLQVRALLDSARVTGAPCAHALLLCRLPFGEAGREPPRPCCGSSTWAWTTPHCSAALRGSRRTPASTPCARRASSLSAARRSRGFCATRCAAASTPRCCAPSRPLTRAAAASVRAAARGDGADPQDAPAPAPAAPPARATTSAQRARVSSPPATPSFPFFFSFLFPFPLFSFAPPCQK